MPAVLPALPSLAAEDRYESLFGSRGSWCRRLSREEKLTATAGSGTRGGKSLNVSHNCVQMGRHIGANPCSYRKVLGPICWPVACCYPGSSCET